MNKPDPAAMQLERLQSVFAGRRSWLVSAAAREPARIATSRPVAQLQQYGYSAALALLFTALLPTAVGLAWRRRKMLFGTVATVLRMRKWRTRLKAVRSRESVR